jgi:hypothetical protein
MMKRILGALLLMVPVIALAQPAPTAVHKFQSSVPLGTIDRVILEVSVAQVDLRNSTDGTIALSGEVRREYDDARALAAAQKIVDASDVVITMRGSAAVIERRFGKDASSRSARGHRTKFDIHLTVPSSVAVEVRQKVGDIDVSGEFGDLFIDVSVGDVRIALPKRSIKELIAKATIGEVSTNLGDRIVTREGIFAGRTHYLNEGGHATLNVTVGVGDVAIDLK